MQVPVQLHQASPPDLHSEKGSIFCFLQQRTRVSISPHGCQCLLLSGFFRFCFFFFLIAAILMHVKWCLTMVSVCISLMVIGDGEEVDSG